MTKGTICWVNLFTMKSIHKSRKHSITLLLSEWFTQQHVTWPWRKHRAQRKDAHPLQGTQFGARETTKSRGTCVVHTHSWNSIAQPRRYEVTELPFTRPTKNYHNSSLACCINEFKALSILKSIAADNTMHHKSDPLSR